MNIDVNMTSNNAEIQKQLDVAVLKALTEMGIKAEKFAKALCPVGTVESTGKKGYRGGTLRRSITYEVSKEEGVVRIGTNVEYAPYVELGTGPYFTPPPEWETFGSKQGSGVGSGYVHPRPFLRPAIADHTSLYQTIIKNNLGGS